MQHGMIIKTQDTVTTDPVYQLGLNHCKTIFLNLPPARLIEQAISRGEGDLTDTGALMCRTGAFTGRAAKDKFIVHDTITADTINWGEVNQPFNSQAFGRLHAKMLQFLSDKKVYVRYAQAGALEQFRMNVAIVTTQAWQNLFCHHLFLRPTRGGTGKLYASVVGVVRT